MMLGFEAINIGKVNETLEMFLFCTVYLLLGKLAAKFFWVQHFSLWSLFFWMMMTMMMLLLMMMKTQLMTACPFACRLSTRTRIVPRCAMVFHQSFYRSFTHMPLGNALPEVFCRSRLHTSAGGCNGRRSLSVTQMQCLEKLHGLRHPKSGDSRKINLHQSLCARTMVSLKHQGKCPESSFRVLLQSPCCSRSQANQGGFHLQRPRLGTFVGVLLRHSG